jgi:hypothetical protein
VEYAQHGVVISSVPSRHPNPPAIVRGRTFRFGRRHQSQTFPPSVPPPEEEKDVKTAIGAARAKQERSRMQKAS